jgi:hypothetical protein
MILWELTKQEKRSEKSIHAFADIRGSLLIKINQQPFTTHF